MSSSQPAEARRRLSRPERRRQLLDLSWRLVREEGSEALTLGRLAEAAGIAKPVVYDHFGTRTGLLVALYQEFDTRQNQRIDAAIAASAPDLGTRAEVIADAYVECVLALGRELPGVVAALSGSRELEEVKAAAEIAFREKCRSALEPLAAGPLDEARMMAMLGAAEALANAAVRGQIAATAAKAELAGLIVAMSRRGPA